MKKITDITKRDIFDTLKTGFQRKEIITYHAIDYKDSVVDFEKEELVEYKMDFSGRLSEIDFLNRLYNLSELPSYDSRYKTAAQDIWQHTINNDDWGDFWFLDDSRFQLTEGEDSYLLDFLSEMFHPVVRNEEQPWYEFLVLFNDLLKQDGYELFEKSHISGRAVYTWREITDLQIIKKYSETEIKLDLKHIGEGSYANVYRFTDDFYKQKFVLKRAKKDLVEKELERFEREYTQMKDLNSPYIVKVYGFVNNEYTMESMDMTLKDFIDANNGKLAFGERKTIVSQVLRGFKYIHSKGLLHRDVSHKNILVKKYDDVNVFKVSDFGLVKIPDSELTSENTEYKGFFNDPKLRLDGFSSYSMLHETYAICNLIYFILTGKTNQISIANDSIKKFMEVGTSSDMNQRFKDVDEIMVAIKNIKEL